MALLCNFAVYSGCNALTRNWNLHSLAIPLDKQIPLIPWTIVIYFGCYIFWIINYILIYRRSREYAYRFLYKIDAPTNLFPSIHCLVSWFCFIGIISDRKIPKWYKVMSFLIAVAVFVSTLTTRQHVIVDVVGGVVLAQICYLIAQKTNIWRCFEKTFDYLNGFFAE